VFAGAILRMNFEKSAIFMQLAVLGKKLEHV
jgi:hypothetical protein